MSDFTLNSAVVSFGFIIWKPIEHESLCSRITCRWPVKLNKNRSVYLLGKFSQGHSPLSPSLPSAAHTESYSYLYLLQTDSTKMVKKSTIKKRRKKVKRKNETNFITIRSDKRLIVSKLRRKFFFIVRITLFWKSNVKKNI